MLSGLWKIRYATYHLIAVIQLQHNIRRTVDDGLRVSVDFNVLKYESLVPCGVQSGLYNLCGFAHMQEGHMDIRIWNKEKYQNIAQGISIASCRFFHLNILFT